MPLNERQKEKALDFLIQTATNNGQSLEELDADLEGLKPADLEKVFEDQFVQAHDEIKKTAVASTIQGAVDSATFGLADKALALGRAAFDPDEDYKQKLEQVEDEHQVARISNPKSYTLGNVAGYFTGFGSLAGKAALPVGKVVASRIGSEFAGKVASSAVQGGLTAGAEAVVRGQDVSSQTAMGTAIGAGAQVAFPPALRLATKIGSGSKSALAYVSSKVHGQLDDETKALIAEAPAVVKIIQNGIGKTVEKSKNFVARLQQKLDEGAKKIEQFTPDEEAVIAGSDIRQSFMDLIEEKGKEIQELAMSKAGVAKKVVQEKLNELATAGQLTGKALSDQYKAKIAPVIAKIGGEKLELVPAIDKFMESMTAAKQVIGGKLVDLADDGTKIKYLNGSIEMLRSNPTFAKVNGFKTALGRTIDWSSDEPAQMAMKDLYNDLRAGLTEKAEQGGFELGSLFGEYQDGLKVVNGFKHAFNKASEKDPIGSLARLGDKIKEEWGQNSRTALFSPETQQAVKHTFFQAKEAASNLKIANNQKLSKSLVKLVRGEGDQTKLNELVEAVGARKQIADAVQQLPLADEAKQLLLDPFNSKLTESVRATIKSQTPKAMDAFESALGKARQLRSANKIPKQTKLTFEQLKATGMKQEWIDQFETVAGMVPEFNSLLREDYLVQLAKSPLLKDTLMDQIFDRAASFGVLGSMVTLDPKKIGMAMGAAVLKQAMSNPAKLAIAAEKSKQFGMGKQLETLINKITFLNDKVFPLVYGIGKNNETVNKRSEEVQGGQ